MVSKRATAVTYPSSFKSIVAIAVVLVAAIATIVSKAIETIVPNGVLLCFLRLFQTEKICQVHDHLYLDSRLFYTHSFIASTRGV